MTWRACSSAVGTGPWSSARGTVSWPRTCARRRFRPRAPLPERPRRALVFANEASEAPQVPAIRRVCEARGIALDAAGVSSRNILSWPEMALPAYDLVFARGRAALEAMAVGAAV